MEIVDEIKKLLNQCKNEEIEIVDEKCMEYFKEILPKLGFDKPISGVVTIGLYLECVSIVPTIFLEYDMKDKNGEYDTALLIFNDKNMKYQNEPTLWTCDYNLKYEYIGLDVWKRIYNYISKK